MDGMLAFLGAWLARAYAVYGLFILLIPSFLFAYLLVLAAACWAAAAHAHDRRPWPWLPAPVRRWGRLALEFAVGLVNPVVYLLVLSPSTPALHVAGDWILEIVAWGLLVTLWTFRFVGAALRPTSRGTCRWASRRSSPGRPRRPAFWRPVARRTNCPSPLS